MDEQGKKSEGMSNKDLFPQLTDDLLILILSMLNCDLKFLCNCMLVSKRFALLIPLISSVTLSIPKPEERSPFEIFRAQVIYASKALRSFRSIRFLHLEFIEEEYREINLQWKAMFGSNTCTCACLVFDSITKLSSAGASAGANVSATAAAADRQRIKAAMHGPIFWRLMYPNMWRNVLAVWRPRVESVVITDSKRQGVVCFGNSELRDATKCCYISDVWNNRYENGRTSIKLFEVPELRLPKSGFLMKGVLLVIGEIGGNSAEEHKHDDMLNCEFGEEQKVLGEASNLILRAPENKLTVGLVRESTFYF
ncbi:hypothetical protein POM88_007894 [Heracleum sosnowskyi]|uniref:F-box protein n=1 Tax=Heracleum sosnowskyi TaxID=360622 RepID=A0AAD8J6E5_9APIA|nr:hypothetical protein POM88_007894 [Heracleum sosnowskyi]